MSEVFIEVLLVSYLQANNVHIFTTEPLDNPPEEYVTYRKLSGDWDHKGSVWGHTELEGAQLGFNCYSGTQLGAMELARRVVRLLEAMPQSEDAASVTPSGVNNLPKIQGKYASTFLATTIYTTIKEP